MFTSTLMILAALFFFRYYMKNKQTNRQTDRPTHTTTRLRLAVAGVGIEDDRDAQETSSATVRCRGNGDDCGRLSCLSSLCGAGSELLWATESRISAAGLVLHRNHSFYVRDDNGRAALWNVDINGIRRTWTPQRLSRCLRHHTLKPRCDLTSDLWPPTSSQVISRDLFTVSFIKTAQ